MANGNNNFLIDKVIRKRWWWSFHSNKKDCDLYWSQNYSKSFQISLEKFHQKTYDSLKSNECKNFTRADTHDTESPNNMFLTRKDANGASLDTVTSAMLLFGMPNDVDKNIGANLMPILENSLPKDNQSIKSLMASIGEGAIGAIKSQVAATEDLVFCGRPLKIQNHIHGMHQ